MIEIVKEKELPKNIRQIGDREEKSRIYMEDYVITYIKQQASFVRDRKVLILYGRKEIIEFMPTWFVSGVLEVEAKEEMDKFIDEHDWHMLNEKAAHYFSGLSVLGWAILGQDEVTQCLDQVEMTWRQFFREDQQLFYYFCTEEETEDLYCFENGHLRRQHGYYIYYEKNEKMQNYMLAARPEVKEEEGAFLGLEHQTEVGNDHATRQFRSIIQEKKDELHHKRTMSFLYGTSSILVMVIMVIGITMLNNYEKMEHMESAISRLSGQVEDGFAAASSKDAVNPVVPAKSDKAERMEQQSGLEQQPQPLESPQSEKQTQATADVETLPEPAESTEPTESIEPTEPTESTESTELTADIPAEPTASSIDAPTDAEPAAPVYTVYEVQKGDTLAKISIAFYGTDQKVAEICALNQITDQDNILYGEKIFLP